MNSIEISSSSRATCKMCKGNTEKGKPRGVTIIQGQRFSSKKYTCHNCIVKTLDKEIDICKELKIKFEEMVNKK